MTRRGTFEPKSRRISLRRLRDWLDAMPHPGMVVEVAASHIAAARWGHGMGHVTSFATEPLPEGTILPSATQPNIVNAEGLQSAIRRLNSRMNAQGQEVALLVPDPVIRVFILSFDSFPRRADETVPLVRWRLKKVLPFEAEEAAISWVRQTSRDGKIEIVAAVARQKIIREYEAALEEQGISAGVVQSSTLAALPLLHHQGGTLLARLSGQNLTTVIVRGDILCVYRSTEIGVVDEGISPQAIFDEIFPAVAFYQDTWGEKVEELRLAGFGAGQEELRLILEREMECVGSPLAASDEFSAAANSLVAQGLESLVGWQMNQGA